MVKESLKAYLDKYFEEYMKYMGSYPVVPYDEEEESTLWFGEVDEEEYIQWKYKEKKIQTDFSQLEKEFGLILPEAAKELYNSYYFLKLEGFYHGESVFLDSISDNRDILNELKYVFENESKKYIPIGFYSCMDLLLCMEIDTGKIVAVDYEIDRADIIADSLEKMLDEMIPHKE